MTDYTITTDFGAKDSLPSGNAAKVIKGSEFTTEFTNIKTAVNSKADTAGDTFTGAVTFDDAVTLNADVTFDTNTMFVDVSANRVGIGNVAPATALDVTGTITADGLSVESSSPSPEIKVHDTDATYGFVLSQFNSGDGILKTDNTERVRITNTGNVGIGTTSPSHTLDVAGQIKADEAVHIQGTGYARLEVGGGTGAFLDLKTPDSDDFDFRMIHDDAGSKFISPNADVKFDVGGSLKTIIKADGNVGIGTSSPAYRLDVSRADVGILARFQTEDGTNNPRITLETTATGVKARSAFGTGIDGSFEIESAGGQSYIALNPNSTEAMRVKANGNVGIGTTSPYVKTEIVGGDFAIGGGAGSGQLGLEVRGTPLQAIPSAQVRGYVATGDSGIGVAGDLLIAPRTSAAASVRFITGTSPAERMRIDSSGNVLVGTTNANLYDDTAGSGIALHANGRLDLLRGSAANAIFNRLGTDGEQVIFRKDGTTVGSISVTASATAYNTSSDERLKENIQDAEDAGSKIDAIQIRQFDWKSDGSHQDYGVIAQELINVAPEAVSEGDTEEDMMGVDYSKLVPMLIKEVQTLRNRVAQLENN